MIVCAANRIIIFYNHLPTTDGHMPRAKTLEIVESKNVFWKAMSLDIQAFVAACPRCKQGETQKRSRGPKRALRWYRGTDDDLDSSDEVGQMVTILKSLLLLGHLSFMNECLVLWRTVLLLHLSLSHLHLHGDYFF